MKVTLFMTISVNGIIARPDYREDFLSQENWLSFLDEARRAGALIWGRKTQEKLQRFAPNAFEKMTGFEKIVVSTDDRFSSEGGFELAISPQDAIAKLQEKGCNEAILSGGSILNSAFAKDQLIDEMKVNMQAVIVGKGIPLFAPADFPDLKLHLNNFHQISERVVQFHFFVLKNQ